MTEGKCRKDTDNETRGAWELGMSRCRCVPHVGLKVGTGLSNSWSNELYLTFIHICCPILTVRDFLRWTNTCLSPLCGSTFTPPRNHIPWPVLTIPFQLWVFTMPCVVNPRGYGSRPFPTARPPRTFYTCLLSWRRLLLMFPLVFSAASPFYLNISCLFIIRPFTALCCLPIGFNTCAFHHFLPFWPILI